MATSLYKAQSAVPMCTKHDKEEIDMYCRTCGKRVCEKCAKSEHKDHDWTRADKEGRAIKRNASSRIQEARRLIADIRQASGKSNGKDDIQRLRRRQKAMKDAIDKYCDKLADKLENGAPEADRSKEINALEKIVEFFEKGIDFAHENVIVEMEEEFRQMVSQSKTTVTKSTGRRLRFIEGKIIMETLEFMLGEVREDTVSSTGNQSDVKITEIASFTHGTEYIRSLKLLSEVEAMIHAKKSKTIERVNKEGKQISEIDTGDCDDFTVIDNEYVCTDFGAKKIRWVSSSGVTTDVTSTAPLRPGGICTARTGGLLVCLCTDDTVKINQDSYGEVHHLDTNGKLLRKYPEHGDDQTNLFMCPFRITQNINLDVCVVDIIATDFTCRLVVVGVNGKKRWEYRGHKSLKKRFCCNGIACDSQGSILLTDVLNDAVHLLTSDGDFIQLLLTEQSGLCYPKSMDVRGDKLWIGCNKGVIKVYQYMYNI